MYFCGLDVLIMVEFISKDINFIEKKKSFLYFPCPQILWDDQLFYLYLSTTGKPQCKFSWNLWFCKQFIKLIIWQFNWQPLNKFTLQF